MSHWIPNCETLDDRLDMLVTLLRARVGNYRTRERHDALRKGKP